MKPVFPEPGTNIANHVKIRKGDIAKAWEQCDVTMESSFSLPQSDHVAMEPRNVRCEIRPDGRVIIYTSSQAPFIVRKLIARYFNIDEGKIIVNTPIVGGAFGGKKIDIGNGKVRTKGISCFWKTSSTPTDAVSGAVITFNPDSSMNLNIGPVELGVGAKTVLAQILAELMKWDVNKIHVTMEVNTELNPVHWKTAASMTTYMVGRAVLEAQKDRIVIGSAVTLTKISEANLVPLLSKAAKTTADHTSRNKITIGGNICGKIPCHEALLPFLLCDSKVVLAGKDGERTVPITQIFDRNFRGEKGELLVQILTDASYVEMPYEYIKKTKMEEIDYPLVTAAVIKKDSRIRAAFSGTCDFPFRSQRIYIKRGYIPDGSGVWFMNKQLEPYTNCNNNYDLVLYLSKSLI